MFWFVGLEQQATLANDTKLSSTTIVARRGAYGRLTRGRIPPINCFVCEGGWNALTLRSLRVRLDEFLHLAIRVSGTQRLLVEFADRSFRDFREECPSLRDPPLGNTRHKVRAKIGGADAGVGFRHHARQ